MIFDDAKLKSILLEQNYVAAEDLEKAQTFAKTHRVSFSEYLITAGLVTDILMGQAVAESLGVPFVDLDAKPPTHDDVLRLPGTVAIPHRVVLAEDTAQRVLVATDNPTNGALPAELKRIFPKRKVAVAYALPRAIDQVLINYRKPLETLTAKIIRSGERVAPEIINAILEDALVYRASDVHLEPTEDEIVVRLRIDGMLREAARIPKEYLESILNRLKVQTRMRIDEHQAAQDGAMRYEKDGHVADLRVSVAPTIDGEKIVMRVLAEYVRGFTLNSLGLSTEHQQLITSAARKPFGMILVTGPTGSGKTTSLYAVLKILNRPEINITTIEDPVEYKVAGVNQIQVNPHTNLTFAAGLKSIVRQDPDIILVGEIRDEETAEIAVNAALTGHLLLSTFHANDAATAIPRLLDMKIEPFLLASTLEVVVAQRLVRRICPNCRYSQTVRREVIEQQLPNAKQYFPEKLVTLYRGKGCQSCNGSEYKGRTAIFEFLTVTPELEELILLGPSGREIVAAARKQGFQTVFEDGIGKVRNGVTTLEELLRVAPAPEA